MIEDVQSFNKRHIFIKMAKPLLIILRIADLNHTHMDKLRFMVLMVDDHIRIYMPELNDKDYFPPVT